MEMENKKIINGEEVVLYFECRMNNNYSHLEVTVHYELGGYSYLTGQQSKRGYYLSLQPCSYNATCFVATMLGSDNESGIKLLLKEVSRKSKKAMQNVIKEIQLTDLVRMASRYGIKSEDCMYICKQIKNELGGN